MNQKKNNQVWISLVPNIEIVVGYPEDRAAAHGHHEGDRSPEKSNPDTGNKRIETSRHSGQSECTPVRKFSEVISKESGWRGKCGGHFRRNFW